MRELRYTLPLCFLLASLALTGCASTYRKDGDKAAYCNQLKSAMVFSGSTSNTRQANIDASTEPNVQRTFDKDNCAT